MVINEGCGAMSYLTQCSRFITLPKHKMMKAAALLNCPFYYSSLITASSRGLYCMCPGSGPRLLRGEGGGGPDYYFSEDAVESDLPAHGKPGWKALPVQCDIN